MVIHRAEWCRRAKCKNRRRAAAWCRGAMAWAKSCRGARGFRLLQHSGKDKYRTWGVERSGATSQAQERGDVTDAIRSCGQESPPPGRQVWGGEGGGGGDLSILPDQPKQFPKLQGKTRISVKIIPVIIRAVSAVLSERTRFYFSFYFPE